MIETIVNYILIKNGNKIFFGFTLISLLFIYIFFIYFKHIKNKIAKGLSILDLILLIFFIYMFKFIQIQVNSHLVINDVYSPTLKFIMFNNIILVIKFLMLLKWSKLEYKKIGLPKINLLYRYIVIIITVIILCSLSSVFNLFNESIFF